MTNNTYQLLLHSKKLGLLLVRVAIIYKVVIEDLALQTALVLLRVILVALALHLARVELVRVLVHHAGDLLGQLQQVDAVLRIASHDLVSFDVLQVVHQYVLAEHVDEGLNVSRHLIHIVGLLQLAEVVVWEGRLKKLDIKLVPEQKSTLKVRPSFHHGSNTQQLT